MTKISNQCFRNSRCMNLMYKLHSTYIEYLKYVEQGNDPKTFANSITNQSTIEIVEALSEIAKQSLKPKFQIEAATLIENNRHHPSTLGDAIGASSIFRSSSNRVDGDFMIGPNIIEKLSKKEIQLDQIDESTLMTADTKRGGFFVPTSVSLDVADMNYLSFLLLKQKRIQCLNHYV